MSRRSGTSQRNKNKEQDNGKVSGADIVSEDADGDKKVDIVSCYQFPDMDTVISTAGALGGFYTGPNTLYKIRKSGKFLLVVHQGEHSAEDFNRLCNILYEYGEKRPYSAAQEAYLAEHEELIIRDEALQKLALLL